MGKLYRSRDRVVAGVCGGLAQEYGFAARNVRLLFVILVLVTFSAAIVLYVILAFLLPEKKDKSYADRMNERLGKK